MGGIECAIELQQEQQQSNANAVKTECRSDQLVGNGNPPFNDGHLDAPLEQETAAVKAEVMEASTLQQNNHTTPGYEGPDPNQTDSGCVLKLMEQSKMPLHCRKRARGGSRGGRQFRERMERRLGSDWKKALKEQRQAQRQLANASIASGKGKSKALHFHKFKERMQAHKKRKALRRSAQPPAAGPSAEMDPAAVEVAKVEMPPLVVAKDE